MRAILRAGAGTPNPRGPGETMIVLLPSVATRDLSAYAMGEQS